MKMQNPFTRGYIEYPLSFEPEKLHYTMQHETPFSSFHSEWLVAVIENGDDIYIPTGENRCRDIYVVTSFYKQKLVQFPKGIYKVPMSYFMAPTIEY